MNSEQFYVTMLNRRRNRAIAIVLGVKEKEADAFLPHDVSERLRKAVLDQVNDLVDFMTDILRSASNDDFAPNAEYWERIETKLDLLLGEEPDAVPVS